ncbi:cytochrome P450 [Novosphingobium album (ex Liu et al. 2023)]|uniref:Cytochrome P450 n=1 Tax=Novosphingobium album (ex Liu et al. 2023) TaxID=3031130 RepID=A0ABT5WSA4_9SPHN|nr:cytochrome P450 [Novosphingobium album (ex Liu et al. 2023)]MDE8652912.1 cytochrome P450 [Novosphingobium album (ex Liu et al. 2023)]
MADELPDFYSDPKLIDDPRPYYDAVRARCPVFAEPYHGSIMVTGYDEVVEVLTTRDGTYSSAPSVVGPVLGLPFEPEGDDITAQLDAHRARMPWSEHLVCFDGQKHAENRALLTSLLTFKRLKANEDYLYALADRLIDGFIDRGRCNVVTDYAHATTTYAISDILGIPEEHRAELLELIGPVPSQLDGDAAHKIGPDPLVFLKDRFDAYIRERQEQPTGDLLSDLANARYKDGTVPDPDMLSHLGRFLYGAGQDTTSRLMARCVLELVDDADLQARLRAEPARIPDFIEEVLRYDGPVKAAYRLALTDTTVGGQPIRAGTILNVSLTGASNDPRHFAHPEKLDIDRPGNRDHLSFSRGVHGCLGAPLGRLETRVVLERLLARTAWIDISEEHHGPPGARTYRFEPTYSFRSLADLHIKFTPA